MHGYVTKPSKREGSIKTQEQYREQARREALARLEESFGRKPQKAP